MTSGLILFYFINSLNPRYALSENLRIDLYHLYHALLGRFMQVCSS